MKTSSTNPNKFARAFVPGSMAYKALKDFHERMKDGPLRLVQFASFGNDPEGPKDHAFNTSVYIDPSQQVATLAQGPGVGQLQDRQTGYIWDTLTVAPSTAFPPLTTMFSVPMQGSTKPLTATNLRDSGKLTYPERMDVQCLRLFVLNNIAIADLLALFTNVSVQIHLNNGFLKWEGLPWMIPSGGGAYISGGFQVGTAPSGSSVYHSTGNGTPDIRNVHDLGVDIIQLGAGENFDMVIQAWTAFNTSANSTNPPGTGITLVPTFEGARYKPFGG